MCYKSNFNENMNIFGKTFTLMVFDVRSTCLDIVYVWFLTLNFQGITRRKSDLFLTW